MLFNPDTSKQAQAIVFSHKKNKTAFKFANNQGEFTETLWSTFA